MLKRSANWSRSAGHRPAHALVGAELEGDTVRHGSNLFGSARSGAKQCCRLAANGTWSASINSVSSFGILGDCHMKNWYTEHPLRRW